MTRQRQLLLKTWILMMGVLAWGSPGMALEEVSKEPLIIQLKKARKASTKNARAEIRKEWQKVCDSIGKAMLNGEGLWGYGPFDNYTCIYQSRLFPKNFKTPSAWVLEATEKKNLVSFTLSKAFRDPKTANTSLEAVLDVPSPDQALPYLAKDDVSKMIAFALAEKMPFGIPVAANASTVTSHTDFDADTPVPDAPTNLSIYALNFDVRKSRWVPTPRGMAKLSETKVETLGAEAEEPQKHSRNRKEKTPSKNRKRVIATWTVTWQGEQSEEAKDQTFFWAMDTRGRGANSKAVTASLAQLVKKDGIKEESFTDKLLDQVANGYVGVRFGQSILKGDPLLVNAKFIGIFTEVRSGVLDGLRFYADIGLEQKVRQYDLDLSFRWKRYTLGWSFAKDLDWWFNRIDLVPKIGIMDIRAVVPLRSLTQEGQYTAGKFVINNAFNFGAEVGIEKNAGWSMFRLWGASDFAIGFLSQAGGGRGTITSLRGGLDAYFDIARLGNSLELSLLLFGLGERISLAQSSKKTSDETEEQIIEGLNYTYGFVGAGLSLAW